MSLTGRFSRQPVATNVKSWKERANGSHRPQFKSSFCRGFVRAFLHVESLWSKSCEADGQRHHQPALLQSSAVSTRRRMKKRHSLVPGVVSCQTKLSREPDESSASLLDHANFVPSLCNHCPPSCSLTQRS